MNVKVTQSTTVRVRLRIEDLEELLERSGVPLDNCIDRPRVRLFDKNNVPLTEFETIAALELIWTDE